MAEILHNCWKKQSFSFNFFVLISPWLICITFSPVFLVYSTWNVFIELVIVICLWRLFHLPVVIGGAATARNDDVYSWFVRHHEVMTHAIRSGPVGLRNDSFTTKISLRGGCLCAALSVFFTICKCRGFVVVTIVHLRVKWMIFHCPNSQYTYYCTSLLLLVVSRTMLQPQTPKAMKQHTKY